MGTLRYGPNCSAAHIPDRTLHHLQIVMVAKLRRSELFTLSLPGEMLDSGSQTTILCAPSVFFEFEYDAPLGGVNVAWINDLALEASSARGLSILPEPEPPQVDSTGDAGRSVTKLSPVTVRERVH